MSDATIHLRVSAALKGRWIRASRAADMRLTDWIIDAVEAHMTQQVTRIAIPVDADFADLNLSRKSDGNIAFDWVPIERICRASNVPIELLREVVQAKLNIGITAAQDWCAAALHTSRRSWQQWERGERAMHAAFAELAQIKIASIAQPTQPNSALP
jgi:hypothetical protein